MSSLDAEYRDLARWAVGRWAAFPVDAEPRPLVLSQPVVECENGFRCGEAKDAWFDGRYEWAVEVPVGVQARARESADREPREPIGAPLKITHAGRAEHQFLTDRGLVNLPAFWLTGPAIRGMLWVLDPQIEHWKPDPGTGGPRPRFRTQGAPLRRTAFSPVGLHADGYAIVVPWSGSPSATYQVELIDTPTAVSAVAIHRPATDSAPGWRTLAGRTHRLAAQLTEPLGNRVFVDLFGEAMQVGTSTS